ncbi:MAG: hypothetical protein ACYTF0_01520 [Planctomycetota bacterium]|jgi:hypothetical protein
MDEAFINPERFRNENELITYIIDQVIEPKLRESLGPDATLDDISGQAFVFGGRKQIPTSTLTRIQQLVGDGMDLDYVLSEMTDLHIVRTSDTAYHNLQIRYVELGVNDDDPPTPSAADLALMFAR